MGQSVNVEGVVLDLGSGARAVFRQGAESVNSEWGS